MNQIWVALFLTSSSLAGAGLDPGLPAIISSARPGIGFF